MDRKNASQNEAWTTVVFFGLTLLLVFSSAYLCINDSLFRVMIALAQQSELLASRYYGEIAPERIFADAWHGMQEAIPFRVELSRGPGQTENPRKHRDWGLTLEQQDSSVAIVEIATNSPFHGFLLPEDKIIGIDSLHEKPVSNLVAYLNSRGNGATTIFFERDGRTDSVTVQISAEGLSGNLSVESVDSIAYFPLRLPLQEASTREILKLRATGALGFIIDLRNSGGDDLNQAQQLSEQLKSIIAYRPTAVLIDGSTKGVTEEIVRQLTAVKTVTTIGSATAGVPSVVEEVRLRSGRSLYVSLNEPLFRSSEDSGDSLSEPIVPKELSTAIEPEIPCDNPRITPLLFELIHGGYFLDFVTERAFTELPHPEAEDSLFSQFQQFLQQRRFLYDPLGRTLSDMSINTMNSEMTPIYQHMRQLHRELDNSGLGEYQDAILRHLLNTIFQVNIGGEPSLAVRARIDDPCLSAAIAHLKDQI